MEKETQTESLKEFFSLMDSAFLEKKKAEKQALEHYSSDLSEFFNLFNSPPVQEEEIIEEKPTLNDFFALFGSLSEKQEPLGQEFTEILQENLPELYESEEEPVIKTEEEVFIDTVVQSITKEEKEKPKVDTIPENYTNLLTNPEVVKIDPIMKAVQAKLKMLEEWISKISMTGPGGGSGSILDIDKPTRTVTSDYTLTRKDYYVGVNCPTECFITLPLPSGGNNVYDGRIVIIKDESGNCQNAPIHILGNIDNDDGGAIVQVNNAALQLLYNNGWKIV